MKLLIISPLLLTLATAKKYGSDSDANNEVKSIISSFYPTSTPDIRPASSTSLASALASIQSTWSESPQFTAVAAAIYSAAPPDVQSSITRSGYRYEDITTQSWYSNVPSAQQTAVAGEVKAINDVKKGFESKGTMLGGGKIAVVLLGVVGVIGVVIV